MKKRSQVRRNSSGSAAAPQTKIRQSRAAALPRKLPGNWSERYIAKEFKVVALRECPLSRELHLCDEPAKAAEYWRLNIATNPYFNSECECLVVLILNTRRHVKGHQLVTIGTMDTLLAHPREMFRAAIVASASAIVLMHNHPSGDPTPSVGDINITRNMIRAGEILRIEVLDHVIVGQPMPRNPTGYSSLRELGYFAEPDAPQLPRRDGRSRRCRKMSKREGSSILRCARCLIKRHNRHNQRRAA